MKRALFILISLLAALVLTVGALAADAPTAADSEPSGSVETTQPAENAKDPSDTVPTYVSAVKPISPALAIIAKDFGMAKAGLVGEKIIFTNDDFRRALNVRNIESITVTSLPSSDSGRLLLGTTAITVGQKISAANFDLIIFSPAADVACSSAFSFIPDDSGVSIECSLYMLTEINETPTTAPLASAALAVSAHTNTPYVGKLAATDPEDDELRFEIISYPSHGMLVLNDMRQGDYTYLPAGNYSGRDSFEYTVRDKYGNYAASTTVNLTVSRVSESVTFSDMSGETSLNDALSAVDSGIMNTVSDNGKQAFKPNGSVSREEFVYYVMKAAGISGLPDVTTTGFTDDAKISAEYKPYVAAAKQLGYIDISADQNGCLYFDPEASITRADAASITDKLINGASLLRDVSAKPVFLDADSIPGGTETSLQNLTLLGMLYDDRGNINAQKSISRADTARIVTAILNISK